MSLTTFSQFFFGHTVTTANNQIDFAEGGPELTALLNIGSYSLEDYATEVARALNAAGAFTYTVTVDRDNGELTISAGSTFSLLVATGSHSGLSAYSMMGFTGADRTTFSTYTGNNMSGSDYVPQFILQDHISTDDLRSSQDETVNTSANGQIIEVIKFGVKKFIQLSIKYSTDISQPGVGPITDNPTGVSDLRTFMQYITTKAPIEYMPDLSDPDTFQTIFLDSTGESPNGTAYTLKERYDRGLPGYFDTSILKFRLVE